MMVFEPAVISINLGDTVKFEATDMAHNSASVPGMIPAGAKPWMGKMSQDISVTFDKEGVYVKKWVTELNKVPSKFIHKPWESNDEKFKLGRPKKSAYKQLRENKGLN